MAYKSCECYFTFHIIRLVLLLALYPEAINFVFNATQSVDSYDDGKVFTKNRRFCILF